MPAKYSYWSHSTPTTDWGAEAKRFRNVKNVTVIEVLDATYRGSTPIAGFFEMVNPGNEPRMLWGSMRAEVYCAWHAVRPLTVFPQIFHDRYVFVDGMACYQSGASFKDGAKASPTTLTQITDAFPVVLKTYEDLWIAGKVER